jgi:hypothetical protein
MASIAALGLSADAPRGWDAEIYSRADEVDTVASQRGPALVETATPILHLANFALPPVRGDYGGGAVELMGTGGIFISLLEHPPDEAGLALFSRNGIPWPIAADDFNPNQMQRTIAGQAGCQRFFAADGRAFCLYVAIGSYTLRRVLLREVNNALATIELT